MCSSYTRKVIDWDALRAAALRASQTAYAPYSGLSVGAAGVATSGEIVTGCNVENASYGMTLCAECGLISDLHRLGATALAAVSIVDGHGHTLLPCGRCRQLLLEHGGPTIMVNADPEPVPLSELLPHAFDARTLDEAVGRVADQDP